MNAILASMRRPHPQAEPRPPVDLVDMARRVSEQARLRAPALDDDAAFPTDDVEALSDSGLLAAPLPVRLGGQALGQRQSGNIELARVLVTIGAGSLPLGRLYEGHVNALKLIAAYGTPDQLEWIAKLVRGGALLGVWNTQVADGVKLTGSGGGRHLVGRKIFCSGAGHVRYPIITAGDDAGQSFMVIPDLVDSTRADLSGWTPHGMRASASGAVDFTGLPIADHQIIGRHDDFHRQPMFSAGAWRFAAVQTGGIGAVLDAARAHLRTIGRADAPHQRARIGSAGVAFQSARQWVVEASRMADDDRIDAQARISYVNLARSAVERAGLDVLELAQRSVGLAGFDRSHPLEKLSRDLATYLRQPNPDGALDDGGRFLLASSTPVADLFPWR